VAASEARRLAALRCAEAREAAASSSLAALRAARAAKTGGALGGLGERPGERTAARAALAAAEAEHAAAAAEVAAFKLPGSRAPAGGGGAAAAARAPPAAPAPPPPPPPPTPGLRLAGLALTPTLRLLLPLVEPYTPGAARAGSPRALVFLGGGPAHVLRNAFLLEALVSPRGGAPGAHAVVLGGWLGAAWVAAGLSPAPANGASAALLRVMGRSACGGAVWEGASLPLARAAGAARCAGVDVVAPLDFSVAPSPGWADARAWNPAPLGPLVMRVAVGANVALKGARAALRKAVPAEVLDAEEEFEESLLGLSVGEAARARAARAAAEAEAEEDARPDADYDSDDSQDMEDLLARNTRRAARSAAADASARAALEASAAVAAALPPEPTCELLAAAAGDGAAAVAAGGAGGGAAPGLARALAPGAPRGGEPTWEAPWGVETASVEHEVPGGGGSGGGGGAAPVALLAAGGGAAAEALLAAARAAPHASLPSLLDVGPAAIAEGVDFIAEQAAAGGDVVFIGAPGVVELADGAAGAAELLGAAADYVARGAGGRLRVAVVGGALCALSARIGLAEGAFAAFAPAPGAGVALMLAAARRSGLTAAVPPLGEGLRALGAAAQAPP
jgi:hypothetical protein